MAACGRGLGRRRAAQQEAEAAHGCLRACRLTVLEPPQAPGEGLCIESNVHRKSMEVEHAMAQESFPFASCKCIGVCPESVLWLISLAQQSFPFASCKCLGLRAESVLWLISLPALDGRSGARCPVITV